MNDEDPSSPGPKDSPVSQSAAEKAWETGFAKLAAFKQEQGHTNVPDPWPTDPALALWMQEQRHAHEYGLLYSGQLARLRTLDWPPLPPEAPSKSIDDSLWEVRYAELAAFHQQHGHLLIPTESAEHEALRLWVIAQRLDLRLGRTLPAHLARLEALGFRQKARAASRVACRLPATVRWEEFFEQLRAFHKLHGHTRVYGRKEVEYIALGKWARLQRYQHRNGVLNAERARLLDELGFEWSWILKRVRTPARKKPSDQSTGPDQDQL